MKIREAAFILVCMVAVGLWVAGLLAALIWFFAFLSVGAVLYALGVFIAGWVWFFIGCLVIAVMDS